MSQLAQCLGAYAFRTSAESARLADGGHDGVHDLALEGPEGDGGVSHAELCKSGAFSNDALPDLVHHWHAHYVSKLAAACALYLRESSKRASGTSVLHVCMCTLRLSHVFFGI